MMYILKNLNQKKNINLNPASQFKDQALDKSEAAYEVMNTLLGHDGTGVFAQELVDEIIKSIAKLFDVLNPTDNVETYDPSMALQLALLTWISNWQPGIYVAAELVQQILLLKALKRSKKGISHFIYFQNHL